MKQYLGVQLLVLVLLARSSSGLVLVQSGGERLVRRDVLEQRFEAKVELALYVEPERMPFIPILWQDPERTGHRISAGEKVRVVGVKESSIGLRRLVWLQVETEPEVEVLINPVGRELLPVPADVSNRGDAHAELQHLPVPATMRGWLRLGGQYRALRAVREQLEAVPERARQ